MSSKPSGRSRYNARLSPEERTAVEKFVTELRNGKTPGAATPDSPKTAAELAAPVEPATPDAGAADAAKSFDDWLNRPSPTEPAIPDGLVGPTVPLLVEDDADTDKAEKDWASVVERYGLILRRIPLGDASGSRQMVLQYLFLNRPPRETVATDFETVDVRDILFEAGIGPADREALMKMSRRLAHALWSNLVQGGDGLSPFAP